MTTVRADTIYYSAPRGHAHTSGTITVPAGGLQTTITLDFYEDDGGDDVELSVASGAQSWNSGFLLMGDGVFPGWTVKTTSSAPPPNYLSLIKTNTQAQMLNINASAFMRMNFNVENPACFGNQTGPLSCSGCGIVSARERVTNQSVTLTLNRQF